LTTLESSVSKVDKENIDVNTVVEESYQLYKADAAKKNLELILDSRIEDMILFTDRNILLNTINNLLDNAIKYTHEGSVTLRLLEEKTDGIDYAVIEVIDTGIGIEKENVELIFDEFRQVSEGYGRSFEGTGLGLSICKKYMNLLGGQIKLSSELYRGSTFRIELPKISNEAYALPQKNAQSADETKISESNIKPRKYSDKILYVENDIDNQTLVEIVFKNYVQVDIANDAIEGIKMSKENDYSIILMDINLGSGMNGNDVTRVIRKNPKYKEIPIVAVTAFALEGDRDEFIESGCTHYLSKPFEVDVMQKLIFGLLEKNG
jgi:CheY-like chemotaxis protein/two-component sensor histidine kinase